MDCSNDAALFYFDYRLLLFIYWSKIFIYSGPIKFWSSMFTSDLSLASNYISIMVLDCLSSESVTLELSSLSSSVSSSFSLVAWLCMVFDSSFARFMVRSSSCLLVSDCIADCFSKDSLNLWLLSWYECFLVLARLVSRPLFSMEI